MQLKKILQKYPKESEYLIEILLEYQQSKEKHFISSDDVLEISKYLDIPESQICSVISFYTLLSLKPKGKYVIQVCHDVPCFVNDATSIYDKLVDLLEIEDGETSKDNMFTLEITECIGCCNESPAMRVNEQVYTRLTPENVDRIIQDLRGDGND
jgi:NADH-quinone oxidoreductase subunit E